MGNQQNLLGVKDTNLPNATDYIKKSQIHQQIQIQATCKSVSEFNDILKRILVRCSYLKYGWAKWTCSQISSKSESFYEHYKHIIQTNACKRQDDRQFFYLSGLNERFLEQFKDRCRQYEDKKQSKLELRRIQDEANCFLMVQTWIKQITLSKKLTKFRKGSHDVKDGASEIENASHFKVQFKDKFRPKPVSQKISMAQTEQRIYGLLLKVNEIFLDHHYKLEVASQIIKQRLSNFSESTVFSQKQLCLIKKISRQRVFRSRQKLILEILEQISFKPSQLQQMGIFAVNQKFQQKVFSLLNVLGVRNVYCVLAVIKNAGGIQTVEKMTPFWNVLCKVIHDEKVETAKSQDEALSKVDKQQQDFAESSVFMIQSEQSQTQYVNN